MRDFVILSKGEPQYHFGADTWQDARDMLITVAFEHQMGLRKQYPPEKIVRSQNMANRLYEIAFTVDNVEVERWKLREVDGGIRGWFANWIAGVS